MKGKGLADKLIEILNWPGRMIKSNLFCRIPEAKEMLILFPYSQTESFLSLNGILAGILFCFFLKGSSAVFWTGFLFFFFFHIQKKLLRAGVFYLGECFQWGRFIS